MLPGQLLTSLRGIPGYEEESFVQVHEAGLPPVSIRLNPAKWDWVKEKPEWKDSVAWAENGYYLGERPVFTLDPLLHGGAYYVQEASSMFLEQAVKKILSQFKPSHVLDLCAAPGGKSTHLLSLLPAETILVSNEVIQSRVPVLIENITKWGNANVVVTQNDPADFSKTDLAFDVIVVDAPCSGSGLFRRDPEAMKEWSLQAVGHCSDRQKRILSDIDSALRPGGFLVYSTCSFSMAENEEITDWLIHEKGYSAVALDWPDGKGGVVMVPGKNTTSSGFRFYPGKVRGEGFFMCLLQKGEDENEAGTISKRGKKQYKAIPAGISHWFMQEDLLWYENENVGYAMSNKVYDLFQTYRTRLHIRKAGVKVAEGSHGNYFPEHDLALSTWMNRDAFDQVDVEKEQALKFLKKEVIHLPANTMKGWNIVTYNGVPIGWVKNLGNRCNNYYPKAWRIRMDISQA